MAAKSSRSPARKKIKVSFQPVSVSACQPVSLSACQHFSFLLSAFSISTFVF
jgi:hypothetical protein